MVVTVIKADGSSNFSGCKGVKLNSSPTASNDSDDGESTLYNKISKRRCFFD